MLFSVVTVLFYIPTNSVQFHYNLTNIALGDLCFLKLFERQKHTYSMSMKECEGIHESAKMWEREKEHSYLLTSQVSIMTGTEV